MGESELLVSRIAWIFEHAFGLDLDIARNQITRCGVQRDLSGAKQQVANAHGMVVRPTAGAERRV
jgi:hypothetical protein